MWLLFYRLRDLAVATGLLVVPRLVDSLHAATQGFPPLSRVSLITHYTSRTLAC
jgi:hypothetical protein